MTRYAIVCLTMAAVLRAASFYPQKPNDAKAVYLVKENFPVHGDGAGDDAPALQQAIDRVQEKSNHGIVFIPPGRYRLGATVNLWRGIRLIGFGEARPVFVLGPRTPGFDAGEGKYMIHFRNARPKPDQPPGDANNTTFYSGVGNIDFEIGDGNPAAVAVRFHVAQLSSLEHIDFNIGQAKAAVEAIGNEIEDCRFHGGDYAIRTGATSPGWQALILDSEFQGQRQAAVETHDAGLTMLRCAFRNTPRAIDIPERTSEKLYLKDVRFENIGTVAVAAGKYFDPRTQLNFENIQCKEVPVFLVFRDVGEGVVKIPDGRERIAGEGPGYVIRQFTHGLFIDGADRSLRTLTDRAPLAGNATLPDKDFPDLPPQSSWVNIADLGAKGDGQTDDTAVFRKAVAQHRAIYVPMGRYRLSDTLTLAPDTALIGMHCWSTMFILAPKTAGFDDPKKPRPMIVTPREGRNIVAGIGFDADDNKGAVALQWMAGASSYLDDALFPSKPDLNKKGNSQFYGLWVTDGGGGVFKNIWAPNNWARNGFFVSNTSTAGRVYEASIEHHADVEVRLSNVSNWAFHALQTEENLGSEKAMAVDIEQSRDIAFHNLFCYRIRRTDTPYPFAVRVSKSGPVLIRGLHVFSGGVFPFDYSVYRDDTRQWWIDREAAYLRLPAP